VSERERGRDNIFRWCWLTILYLAYVSYNEFFDAEFNDLSSANDIDPLVTFDLGLKTSKLAFFSPIIESGYEHNHDDGKNDGCTLDPTRSRFIRVGAVCKETESIHGGFISFRTLRIRQRAHNYCTTILKT